MEAIITIKPIWGPTSPLDNRKSTLVNKKATHTSDIKKLAILIINIDFFHLYAFILITKSFLFNYDELSFNLPKENTF